MASSTPHHQYYCSSNYSFSTDHEFCSTLPIPTQRMLNNIEAAINVQEPLMNYDGIDSPVSVASFPDQYLGAISDCMIVPQMSEIEMGFRDFAFSDHCNHHHQAHVFEPGEDYCSGFVPNYFRPDYPMAAENSELRGKPEVKIEETEVKVGRYSVEERKDKILRYLKKRNQRNFNKTIKYACRKTLADKRVRIRGRFAKNNEPCEEEQQIAMMNNKLDDDTSYDHQNMNYFYDDFSQMKHDDEEDYWLQAAMANLVYLPYLAS